MACTVWSVCVTVVLLILFSPFYPQYTYCSPNYLLKKILFVPYLDMFVFEAALYLEPAVTFFLDVSLEFFKPCHQNIGRKPGLLSMKIWQRALLNIMIANGLGHMLKIVGCIERKDEEKMSPEKIEISL